MIFFLDENFPKTVASRSTLAKHEIIDIRESGKPRSDESVLMNRIEFNTKLLLHSYHCWLKLIIIFQMKWILVL